MSHALVNGRIFTGEEFLDDKCVIVNGAFIADIVRADEVPKTAARIDLNGAILAPGFIDTQVNGGGGRLFNTDPSAETIRIIGAAHRRFGTTGYLPTLISDELDVVRRAIEAIEVAIAAGAPGLLGVHLEGPFLSTDRRGVHDATKFRHLTNGNVEMLTALRGGKTLITLAPENAAPALIRNLTDRGAIVSAGHTNTTYEITRAALDSGLAGFTHLFNAMSFMTSREPGVLGAALEDQASWCGIVVDGRHVSPTCLKIAMRCKPIDKFMLVTDAMPTVGMVDKRFALQGRQITVEDGVCVTGDGTLAGSDLDMAKAVRNAISMLDVSLTDALRMAALNPAAFLGLDDRLGRIAPGYRANLVALSQDHVVVETWINGQPSTPALVPSATATIDAAIAHIASASR